MERCNDHCHQVTADWNKRDTTITYNDAVCPSLKAFEAREDELTSGSAHISSNCSSKFPGWIVWVSNAKGCRSCATDQMSPRKCRHLWVNDPRLHYWELEPLVLLSGKEVFEPHGGKRRTWDQGRDRNRKVFPPNIWYSSKLRFPRDERDRPAPNMSIIVIEADDHLFNLKPILCNMLHNGLRFSSTITRTRLTLKLLLLAWPEEYLRPGLFVHMIKGQC